MPLLTGDAMPDQADLASFTTYKKKSGGGCIRRNYQYLAGGLLETLAVIAPHAKVILTGDPYEKIQSET
jgi:hypothetical protein